MATYGIYQVLDPLYVTRSGSVCSAKIVGGEAAGRIAVKILNPPKPDPDEPNWEPKYFLDRAQVQRRVSAAGAAFWAPVYALGFTPEGGAYYVTDYHALSVQKMMDGCVTVDAIGLHAIIRSVLNGLEELRKIAGRAHANLKPGNVLIVGKGPAEEMRAVLCDPGQEFKAQKDGEAGDLRAMGALIYALVQHRPPVDSELPPPPDVAWERLGDKAEAWRQLCIDLLKHPISPRVSSLSALGKIVDGLAPARMKVPHLRLSGKSKTPAAGSSITSARMARVRAPKGPSRFKSRLIQVVALLVLVGGTLGVLTMLEAKAREQLCTARAGWFGSLAAGLAEPQRRERFAADPHLTRIAEGVDEIERANVDCTDSKPRVLGFLQFLKTRKAVASLRGVEQALAPESWPQLVKLRDWRKTFDDRGWQQPSAYVTQLLEGVRPNPAVSTALARPSTMASTPLLPAPASLAQRIDRILRLHPLIEQQAETAEGDWKALDERVSVLEASQDPIIHGFGSLLRREAIASLRLGAEGFEGLPQLKQNAGLAGQVTDAIRSSTPDQFDAARFNREVVRPTMASGDLEMDDLQRWLSQRPNYIVKREQVAEAATKLQKSYDATATEVAKSAPEPEEVAAFELEQKNVEAALRDFRQTPFIERDITEGRLATAIMQIESQIANLKRYYHAEDANDWLKNLAPFVAGSERLKSRWEAWVATLKGDIASMSEDRTLFAKNKTRTDRLRDVLTELEVNFPVPPTDLSDGFAAAASQKREEQLGALLETVNIADPALDEAKFKQATQAIAGWYGDLKSLNGDFPLRKKLLSIDDRPHEKWRKNEAFWNDGIVQRLVRGDVERIERLQKLRLATRADLIKATGTEAVRPEVVVAAWQLLGESAIKPEWPATAAELETEAGLRGKVAAATESLSAEERKPLDELLASEGPRRWRRFVEAADSEAMLIAALGWQQKFGINGVVVGDMAAPARFNVWLCVVNLAIRDNDDAGLDKVVEKLRTAAAELEEPKASQVQDKLAKLETPDPFSDRNLADVFQLDIAGVNEPMEFRRVEPKNGARPFYLATREVTLAQFTGAIEGKSLWPETQKLSWPYKPGKGDGRRGARVWEWAGNDPSRPSPAALWMARDEVNKHNDFPSVFHPQAKFNRNVIDADFGGMPSERHPMQYVSAQAALFYAAALGCRLPTSSEWKSALEASGKTVQNGPWNLRDQSWETFRQHATKSGIAPEHWPDRGAFPFDAAAPTAEPARGRGGNDNILLFRPAPSHDGAFHDLVGNVAEYLCETPDAFSRWHDKSTADNVKNFLVDTPNAVAVIGGSALSPADQPIDKPIAVTRTDRGFSDVGLRLAFTAPARNRAERLKWVLAGEDYVWPRAASADTGVR